MKTHCEDCGEKFEQPSNHRLVCGICRVERRKKSIYQGRHETNWSEEDLANLRKNSPWYDSDPERTPF